VKWYRNEWYKNPKSLWATFNEGQNVSGKISIGLQGGVSDLLLYERNGRGLIGIEMKYPGESHNVLHVIRQAQWILDVCDCGGFVDTRNSFIEIIKGNDSWIDPKNLLIYLEKLRTKTFIWNSSIFL
jgi:hypothetical protein